eukprot:SM000080S22919  [mRNA]  locus=s80:101257:107523:+ [translate_table: standard]
MQSCRMVLRAPSRAAAAAAGAGEAGPEAGASGRADKVGQPCAAAQGRGHIRVTAPVKLGSFNDEASRKRASGRVLGLFSGLRSGGDLSRLQLPPQFNLPKSQLQLYGESVYCCAQDILGACANAPTPFERFLNVLRWHLSTTRIAPFGKAPYNPVLGETHHVSCGDLNVSHHPPVSALYATSLSKNLRMMWWHKPQPRFMGTWMEAVVHGPRRLFLDEYHEVYEMTCPRLSFRFLPSPGTEWVGETTVLCQQTGYEAVVKFKSKSFFGMGGANNRIGGKICNSRTKESYELSGAWDKTVTIKDSDTGKSRILYDFQSAVGEASTPQVVAEESLAPMESLVVWNELTGAVLNGNWDVARQEKQRVEEAERALRKQREAEGQVWQPQFFVLDAAGNWVWKCDRNAVPKAPIIVDGPCCTLLRGPPPGSTLQQPEAEVKGERKNRAVELKVANDAVWLGSPSPLDISTGWSLSQSAGGAAPQSQLSENDKEFLREALEANIVDVVKRMKEISLVMSIPEEQLQQQGITVEDQEGMLDELQEHVESIDMANDLKAIGGLTPLLSYLRSPHPSLQARAAEIVQTIVQNNPKSQGHVMEAHGLEQLMAVFTNDPDVIVQSKALGAISSLIRHNKQGIDAFRLSNGYPALNTAISSDEPRLQRRASLLLAYLLQENPTERVVANKLAFARPLTRLLSSANADVRQASLQALLQLVQQSADKAVEIGSSVPGLKEKLQERMTEIASLSKEDLAAAREERHLTDAVWQSCYPGTASSLRTEGLLVTEQDEDVQPPPVVAVRQSGDFMPARQPPSSGTPQTDVSSAERIPLLLGPPPGQL